MKKNKKTLVLAKKDLLRLDRVDPVALKAVVGGLMIQNRNDPPSDDCGSRVCY